MRIFVFLMAAICMPSLTSAATPVARAECKKPDVSFKSFLPRFTDDKAFRSIRTVLPLVARAGDGVTVPTSIELWTRTRTEALKTPLINSRQEMKKKGLVQNIGMLDAEYGYAEVFQGQPEADAIKLLYGFRRHGGCWFLEEFNDLSE
jgi:hypothetical protein